MELEVKAEASCVTIRLGKLSPTVFDNFRSFYSLFLAFFVRSRSNGKYHEIISMIYISFLFFRPLTRFGFSVSLFFSSRIVTCRSSSYSSIIYLFFVCFFTLIISEVQERETKEIEKDVTSRSVGRRGAISAGRLDPSRKAFVLAASFLFFPIFLFVSLGSIFCR